MCLTHTLKKFKAFAEPEGGKGFVWVSGKPYSTEALRNLVQVASEVLQRIVSVRQMNPVARQRILRSFLASLLQSEISFDDMRDLAKELENGLFGRELSKLLYNSVLNIEEVNIISDNDSSIDPNSAYNIIAARKMPKKMVLELMKVASPRIPENAIKSLLSRSLSGKAVKKYFDLASASERKVFLDIIQGKTADAFLSGINRDRFANACREIKVCNEGC